MAEILTTVFARKRTISIERVEEVMRDVVQKMQRNKEERRRKKSEKGEEIRGREEKKDEGERKKQRT